MVIGQNILEILKTILSTEKEKSSGITKKGKNLRNFLMGDTLVNLKMANGMVRVSI